MSVDERLREAFAETDHTWDARAAAALRDVTVTERRRRLTRRTAVGVAAAAAIAAVAVIARNPGDRNEVPAPEPTPTPTPTTETVNPLDGYWVSEPVTGSDVRTAARLAGASSVVDAMLDELPPPPFRITLYIEGDRNELVTHIRFGDREDVYDQENLEVAGDLVNMSAQLADGGSVHRWSLTDGTLRMEFVSTTEKPSLGVPAAAWHRLMYDMEPFRLQD